MIPSTNYEVPDPAATLSAPSGTVAHVRAAVIAVASILAAVRRLIVVTVVAISALGLAAPAFAEPPSGSASTCPPLYEPMTLPEILAQAQGLGIPEGMARALFQLVNKNEDAWICQRKLLPDVATSYNFVDNQAVGLDRQN